MDKTPEEKAEDVIMAGFLAMDEKDSDCLADYDRRIPVENALSYNWATKAIASFSNLCLRSKQSSESNGEITFNINGVADTTVQFIRDVTNVKCFVEVNIVMKGDGLMLPQDSTYRTNIYTYVHETNTLYRSK